MAGKVVNIKICSPLKLRSGLTGKSHAICHYSYNLSLCGIQEKPTAQTAHLVFPMHKPTLKKPKELFFANARPKNEQNEENRKKRHRMNCTFRNSIKKKEIWS